MNSYWFDWPPLNVHLVDSKIVLVCLLKIMLRRAKTIIISNGSTNLRSDKENCRGDQALKTLYTREAGCRSWWQRASCQSSSASWSSSRPRTSSNFRSQYGSPTTCLSQSLTTLGRFNQTPPPPPVNTTCCYF